MNNCIFLSYIISTCKMYVNVIMIYYVQICDNLFNLWLSSNSYVFTAGNKIIEAARKIEEKC
jgi:hypothetical protein